MDYLVAFQVFLKKYIFCILENTNKIWHEKKKKKKLSLEGLW